MDTEWSSVTLEEEDDQEDNNNTIEIAVEDNQKGEGEEELLTQEDCEKIIEVGKKAHLEKATVFGGMDLATIRNSYVSWLYPNQELQIYYRRFTDVITELNRRYFHLYLIL